MCWGGFVRSGWPGGLGRAAPVAGAIAGSFEVLAQAGLASGLVGFVLEVIS